MKNINWSKWIAIVLSVFILTQFVQVSFLAARQVGNGQADAGVDASKGSLAEEIYQGVWDAVGDSDSMILSASADENAPVEDPDADPEIDESAPVGSRRWPIGPISRATKTSSLPCAAFSARATPREKYSS